MASRMSVRRAVQLGMLHGRSLNVTEKGSRALRSHPAMSVQKRHMAATVVVEKPDTQIIFPRENPTAGWSYDLNWSLCGSGVVPQGKSFRNLKASELQKAGGSLGKEAPKVVPWSSALEQEVTAYLGSASVTRYVQDSALGALLANEVHARIVTDSAATALQFKTWLSTTKLVPVSSFKESITVLAAVGLTTKGAFISYDPKTKTVLIGGTSVLDQLVDFFPQATAEAFVSKGALPLWGSLVGDTLFASSGFESGATIKYGCSYSSAGFCRLFMGSISGGEAKDEYKAFPNSIPVPKSVVLFANEATGTIPAASKLSAAQAAYYYVGAAAPAGLSSFAAAAKIVADLGSKSQIYLINRGAFSSADAASKAAKDVVGKSGSASGLLGLEAISVDGAKPAPANDVAEKAAKALVASVEGRIKGLTAVLSAGPKLPQPAAK